MAECQLIKAKLMNINKPKSYFYVEGVPDYFTTMFKTTCQWL
jgi:hypothetical protein